MTLNPRKSPVVFSALFAWGVLFAFSFLPIWTAKEMVGSVMVIRLGTDLWDILWQLPFDLQRTDPADLVARHRDNLVLAAATLTIGAVTGRFLFWQLWEREAKPAAVQPPGGLARIAHRALEK